MEMRTLWHLQRTLRQLGRLYAFMIYVVVRTRKHLSRNVQ